MFDTRTSYPRPLWRIGLIALLLLSLASVALPAPAPVAAASVTLAADRASGQPVGTTVAWTATPADGRGARVPF